ncbi:hypothetical protein BKA62DRAFT_661081 [Auriculariales sp. MPI-PUGE-AT-0066]|nr:hypothetical protein BKA62DRAFT_661081 [Auriculariales sp. MPI-PUGE-AT-0066]
MGAPRVVASVAGPYSLFDYYLISDLHLTDARSTTRDRWSYQRTCAVQVPSGTLPTGEHTFNWGLAIPRSSAPYERSQYGTISHDLVAVAEFEASGQVQEKMLQEMVINPIADGETSVVNERIEDFNAEIGPYSATILSPHLSIGGPLRITFSLGCCPAGGLDIHSISGIIQQRCKLKSFKSDSSATPKPQEHVLFHLDHATSTSQSDDAQPKPSGLLPIVRVQRPISDAVDPERNTRSSPARHSPHALVSLEPNQMLDISHIARMPPYERIQASTPDGTDSPFHNSHTIRIDVTFTVPGPAHHPAANGKKRVLHIERAVRVISCGCMPASVVLPSYDEAMLDSAVRRGHHNVKRVARPAGEFYTCMSVLSMNALLEMAYFEPLFKSHEEFALPGLAGTESLSAGLAASKHVVA